jgi:sulfate adenylyltransferase
MATGRTCPHGEEDRLNVSGTRLREMLANNEAVPTEFSRPEVLEVLRKYYYNVDN